MLVRPTAIPPDSLSMEKGIIRCKTSLTVVYIPAGTEDQASWYQTYPSFFSLTSAVEGESGHPLHSWLIPPLWECSFDFHLLCMGTFRLRNFNVSPCQADNITSLYPNVSHLYVKLSFRSKLSQVFLRIIAQCKSIRQDKNKLVVLYRKISVILIVTIFGSPLSLIRHSKIENCYM